MLYFYIYNAQIDDDLKFCRYAGNCLKEKKEYDCIEDFYISNTYF